MTGKRFIGIPGNKIPPILCQGALCACWGKPSTLSQIVYNSALALISCLCRPSRSFKSESLGFFQVSPEHVHSPGHVCGQTESQKCIWAFHSPYRHFIPQFFLQSFLVSVLFAPTDIYCLRQLWLKYLPMFLTKHSPHPRPPQVVVLALG